MMLNFVECAHPVFRATNAVGRGFLRKKGGKVSIDLENAELLFRTINSVNQLSIYGAFADWCEELVQHVPAQASSSIEIAIAKVNEQLDRSLASEDVKTKNNST